MVLGLPKVAISIEESTETLADAVTQSVDRACQTLDRACQQGCQTIDRACQSIDRLCRTIDDCSHMLSETVYDATTLLSVTAILIMLQDMWKCAAALACVASVVLYHKIYRTSWSSVVHEENKIEEEAEKEEESENGKEKEDETEKKSEKDEEKAGQIYLAQPSSTGSRQHEYVQHGDFVFLAVNCGLSWWYCAAPAGGSKMYCVVGSGDVQKQMLKVHKVKGGMKFQVPDSNLFLGVSQPGCGNSWVYYYTENECSTFSLEQLDSYDPMYNTEICLRAKESCRFIGAALDSPADGYYHGQGCFFVKGNAAEYFKKKDNKRDKEDEMFRFRWMIVPSEVEHQQ